MKPKEENVNELTNTLKQNYLSEYSDLRKQKLEIEERMSILDGEISKIILLEDRKEEWIDKFQEHLWGHHQCDWDVGNSYPNYPYQLAVAYFDWDGDEPAYTVEEAFQRYLDNDK